MNEELKKELFSLPSIATFIGTGLGIWTLVQGNTALTFAVLSLVVLILFGYLFALHRKNTEQKKKIQQLTDEASEYSRRLAEVCRGAHKLTHRSRDYLSDARTSPSGDRNDLTVHLVAALKMALTTASGTFGSLVGAPCTASLMLKQKDGRFRTILYCHNASPQRESRQSDPLPSTHGIVGKAMATADAVVWLDSDPVFVRTRQDYSKFYRSGICIPFRKSFEYVGLLNVDSVHQNIFDYDDHKELAAAFADQIGLILECNDVMGGHFGNS